MAKQLKKFMLTEATGKIVDLGDDGTDPIVQVSGYGQLKLSQIKAKVHVYLEKCLTDLNHGRPESVKWTVENFLPTLLAAIIDVETELQTNAVKRKISQLRNK